MAARELEQAHWEGRDGTPETAVVYNRTSTEEQQAHGENLDRQCDRCVAYCQDKAYNLNENDVYQDIASGGDTNRSDFLDLIRRIREGDIDVVVAWTVDRFGRNDVDTALLLHECSQRGVRIESVASGGVDFTSNPFMEFQYRIQAALAILNRKLININAMDGKESARDRGYWPSGPAPLGYETRGPNGRKVLVPDENADHVRDVFHLYANEECSLHALSKKMRAREVRRRPRDPESRVLKFSAQYIGKILAEPAYRGCIDWNGTEVEGNHEGLVSEALWRRANQRRLERRKKYPGRGGG